MSRMRAFAVSASALALLSVCLPGQGAPERFWLAGLYDGSRVVIYFDAVRFKMTAPPGAHNIPEPPGARPISPPVAAGFFDPVELPADYIAGLQAKPGAERFATGDR